LKILVVGTGLLSVAGAALAAGTARQESQAPAVLEQSQLPFGPGERMVFDVRFGPVRVGTATMEVRPMTAVRGRRAYHTVFTLRGGTFFYKVNDVLQSWMDAQTLASLRHTQDIEQGSRERERTYEIYPDRRVYVETSSDSPTEQPSVDQPLDDGSFLYFIRTVPLDVGQNLEFNRYFRPDRNPVRVRVERKETVRVPAGSFEAVVLRPTIKTRGIFAEGGQAEVWIADSDRRELVQIRSRLSFGSISLHLRQYIPPTN
jgi:hypothetical protein